uniref:Uncharacterized protein n=1 Tax=Physcomitrium patens TaxID=3218 RepID=A0A2K1K411_PHYPA|nr:hypothetical protein PHYPA_012987 [Physcomitrium patens]
MTRRTKNDTPTRFPFIHSFMHLFIHPRAGGAGRYGGVHVALRWCCGTAARSRGIGARTWRSIDCDAAVAIAAGAVKRGRGGDACTRDHLIHTMSDSSGSRTCFCPFLLFFSFLIRFAASTLIPVQPACKFLSFRSSS